ncbi:hypothetical protein ACIOD0_22310 [Kitasatospora albolonga]
MPRADGWGLAVDIGGAWVKAAYWDGRGGVGTLPVLPATVYRDLDGRLLTGPEAVRLARTAPERAETMPVRSLAEQDEALLGGEPTAPADMVTALLARVLRDLGPGFGGSRPDALTVVVPSGWGGAERTALARAAGAAGLPEPDWLPAPLAVAAGWAAYREVPDGTVLAVCDAGATGLRCARVEPDRAAYESGDEVACGGADLDEVLLALVEARAGAAAGPEGGSEAWERLLNSAGPEGLRARAQVREDITGVRETLSATVSAPLVVPGLGVELLLRRAEFEEAAQEPLNRAGAALRELLDAGPGASTPLLGGGPGSSAPLGGGARPSAVLLTGGVARTPRLAELLAVDGRLPELLPDPVNAAVLGAARARDAPTAPGGGEAPYSFPGDDDLFL